MATPEEEAAWAATRRRPARLIFNAVLVLAAFGLAGASIVDLIANPFGGMRAPTYLVQFVLLAFGFNRLLALASGLTPRRIQPWVQFVLWSLCCVLSVPVLAVIEQQVQAAQDRAVAGALAPVIAHADAQLAASGRAPVQGLPAVQFPLEVRYAAVAPGYQLWLTVPAIDIDGYTLRYDPAAKWQRLHNDEPGAASLPEPGCTLKGGEWRCVEPPSAKPG